MISKLIAPKMSEVKDRFFHELPKFLPHSPEHHQNQVIRHLMKLIANGQPPETKSGLKTYLTKVAVKRFGKGVLDDTYVEKISHLLTQAADYQDIPIHYDMRYMENTLKNIFGETTMGDLPNTLIITSHKIDPGRRESFDFQAFDPRFILENSPVYQSTSTAKVPVYQANMAATAVPTVAGCYTTSLGTTHIDQAHIDSGARQVVSLKKSYKHDYDVKFVQFGNVFRNKPIDPADYNELDCISMLVGRELIDASSIQAQDDARKLIECFLGKENTQFIEMSDPADIGFNLNFLDTSPEQTDKIISCSEAFLHKNKDMFDSLFDTLGDNFERHREANMARHSGFSIVKSVKSVLPKLGMPF